MPDEPTAWELAGSVKKQELAAQIVCEWTSNMRVNKNAVLEEKPLRRGHVPRGKRNLN